MSDLELIARLIDSVPVVAIFTIFGLRFVTMAEYVVKELLGVVKSVAENQSSRDGSSRSSNSSGD